MRCLRADFFTTKAQRTQRGFFKILFFVLLRALCAFVLKYTRAESPHRPRPAPGLRKSRKNFVSSCLRGQEIRKRPPARDPRFRGESTPHALLSAQLCFPRESGDLRRHAPPRPTPPSGWRRRYCLQGPARLAVWRLSFRGGHGGPARPRRARRD